MVEGWARKRIVIDGSMGDRRVEKLWSLKCPCANWSEDRQREKQQKNEQFASRKRLSPSSNRASHTRRYGSFIELAVAVAATQLFLINLHTINGIWSALVLVRWQSSPTHTRFTRSSRKYATAIRCTFDYQMFDWRKRLLLVTNRVHRHTNIEIKRKRTSVWSRGHSFFLLLHSTRIRAIAHEHATNKSYQQSHIMYFIIFISCYCCCCCCLSLLVDILLA